MDFDKARKELANALLLASKSGYEFGLPKNVSTALEVIINGHHLTYKYILVTAILAKNTDPSIHMRSLQAGSDLVGAYDARSLCHKVFVPFERDELDSKLGGSNEPFLNKPARFPAVELSNPVRKGKDKQILDTLFAVLNTLNSPDSQSYLVNSLSYSIFLISQKESLLQDLYPEKINEDPLAKLLSVKDSLLSESFEGEFSVILLAIILKGSLLHSKKHIIVHPVNQSGKSSNEVGDIDVYCGKKVSVAIEIKDKDFTEHDVKHAVKKASISNVNRLWFVTGPNGKSDTLEREKVIAESLNSGVLLTFSKLNEYANAAIQSMSLDEIISSLNYIPLVAKEIRCKEETGQQIKVIIDKL